MFHCVSEGAKCVIGRDFQNEMSLLYYFFGLRQTRFMFNGKRVALSFSSCLIIGRFLSKLTAARHTSRLATNP